MNNFIGGFMIGFVAALVIMSSFINADEIWHQNIVRQGHGEYNSTTGEFQFLPPCNKEK
jgi:hypothetical protein